MDHFWIAERSGASAEALEGIATGGCSCSNVLAPPQGGGGLKSTLEPDNLRGCEHSPKYLNACFKTTSKSVIPKFTLGRKGTSEHKELCFFFKALRTVGRTGRKEGPLEESRVHPPMATLLDTWSLCGDWTPKPPQSLHGGWIAEPPRRLPINPCFYTVHVPHCMA